MFTNKSFTNRFPLITFFLLAFAGTWLVISQFVFDSLGWIDIPEGVELTGWLNVIAISLAAILLISFTRGKLV